MSTNQSEKYYPLAGEPGTSTHSTQEYFRPFKFGDFRISSFKITIILLNLYFSSVLYSS